MSKIEVTAIENGSRIQIETTGSEKDRLVLKINACASGNSSCSLANADTISDIKLSENSRGLQVEVVTRNGDSLAPDAVQKCLTMPDSNDDSPECC